MVKTVFLDRDGTINVDNGYTYKVEDFYFEKNVIPALKLLQGHGFELIIVTNQSGIGRGLFTMGDFRKFNNHLINQLEIREIKILKTYFSPYHPEKGIGKYKKITQCRKPNPGMLEQAEKDFYIDKNMSWIVGDKWTDVKTGNNFGIKSILIQSKNKSSDTNNCSAQADFITNDILEAAKFIINYQNDKT